MCLAVPAKIVKIDPHGEHATIDYGDGTKREANVSLVEVQVGDYVLIHAGFAIQVLDEDDAQKTLDLFREMMSVGGV